MTNPLGIVDWAREVSRLVPERLDEMGGPGHARHLKRVWTVLLVLTETVAVLSAGRIGGPWAAAAAAVVWPALVGAGIAIASAAVYVRNAASGKNASGRVPDCRARTNEDWGLSGLQTDLRRYFLLQADQWDEETIQAVKTLTGKVAHRLTEENG